MHTPKCAPGRGDGVEEDAEHSPDQERGHPALGLRIQGSEFGTKIRSTQEKVGMKRVISH